MICPLCPKCGSGMTVRTAKQGFNAGGEFWGCNNFPSWRGTVPVPRHDWDWYQLVPIPVRIIANQQRWLDEAAANDPSLNPWIEYYESTEGIFGPYVDYDEHMWAFEEAMETAERYYDSIADAACELEKPTLRKIEQILDSNTLNLSMAQRATTVVERYIQSESSVQKLGSWLTETFNGSTPALAGPEHGGIDGGFVTLDDHSRLIFHRTPEGIFLAEWKIKGRGLSALRHTNLLSRFGQTTANLSMRQFEQIARHFSRNFGIGASTNILWSV